MPSDLDDRVGRQFEIVGDCRVIEKAPVMIDWLAMIVATVASSTSGTNSADGRSW